MVEHARYVSFPLVNNSDIPMGGWKGFCIVKRILADLCFQDLKIIRAQKWGKQTPVRLCIGDNQDVGTKLVAESDGTQ